MVTIFVLAPLRSNGRFERTPSAAPDAGTALGRCRADRRAVRSRPTRDLETEIKCEAPIRFSNSN